MNSNNSVDSGFIIGALVFAVVLPFMVLLALILDGFEKLKEIFGRLPWK